MQRPLILLAVVRRRAAFPGGVPSGPPPFVGAFVSAFPAHSTTDVVLTSDLVMIRYPMEPLPARHGSRILIKALLGTSALVAASVASLSALFLLRDRAAFQRQFELRAEALAGSL